MGNAEASRKRYQAFISYSQALDGELARALQVALQRFAKPWYVVRAVRVFRDETGLSISPAIWPSIERALDQSAHFILLASPAAAESPWVRREVDYWISKNNQESVLIVLAEGNLRWDRSEGDFDWSRTNALPPALRGVYKDEPRWIDLTWARSEAALSLRHPALRNAVADISAPIRGVDKDELIGEDIAQHRRTMLVTWAALVLLVFLTISSIVIAIYARHQANIAQEEAIAERGARANVLAQQSGREGEGLNLAAEAVAMSVKRGHEPEPEVIEGLVNSVSAVRYLRSLKGHVKPLSEAIYSPDGEIIATASTDHMAKLWDSSTGRLRFSLTGHLEAINSIAFSASSAFISTASSDHTARLWDSKTGRLVREFRGHTGPVLSVVFSPDDQLILTSSDDRTARLWDRQTGACRRVFQAHLEKIVSAVFSHDGKRVLTASWDNTAQIWEAARREPVTVLRGHSSGVSAAVFSNDDRRVATASLDGTSRVWDAQTGKVLTTLVGHGNSIQSVAFSNDGSRVFTSGYDGTSRMWDSHTGKLETTFGRHNGSVSSAALSPDNKRLVTAGWDRTAKLWDVYSGDLIANLVGHTGRIMGASFSPDGRWVVTAGEDGSARVWSARSDLASLVQSPSNDGVWCSAALLDGSRVLVRKGAAELRNAAGKTVQEFHLDKSVRGASAIAPGREKIALSTEDNSILMFSTADGRQISTLVGHMGEINAIVFSRDGKKLLTASKDSTARLWDTDTGACLRILRAHTGSVNSVNFSADGAKMVTAGDDGVVQVWDTRIGSIEATLFGHDASVDCAAFSPDGRRIVTASSDHTAAIWDVSRKAKLATLTGHTEDVTRCDYAPDGFRVVTSGLDDTIRLWDASTGKPLGSLRIPRSSFSVSRRVSSLFFSGQGSIVSVSYDGTLRIYPEALHEFMALASVYVKAAEVTDHSRGGDRLK